ncbi:MAG TPA: hypothetical protein VGF94_08140 [Kofleriaceae bacterium]|jgi:hypothetical protein
MGLQGLDYQLLQIPFSAGLNTKQDPRALEAPELEVLRDAQFDSLDAVSTRFPYLSIGTDILGGGTLANVRRIYECNGELVCFTIDSIYSWDARDSAWVLRGTCLAVAPTEATRFATTDDQINADRAELAGTMFFAWSNGSAIFVAAMDKTTGAVIGGPLLRTSSGTRPRLVALQTKVALVFDSGGALEVQVLDPANAGSGLLTGALSLIVAAGTFNSYYDVAQVPGTDSLIGACRNTTMTTHTVFTVAWTGSTWNVSTLSKARTCDGPIAVAPDPDAAHVQIARANGSNIQGDLLTLGLGDTFTAQAIGTVATSGAVNQIAACFRSTQVGGHWRCMVFWSANENTANTSGFAIETNWVDDGNNLGAKSTFLPWCGLGSRAFTYNGFVYVWAAFGQTSGLGSGAADTSSSGQFQNAYYLMRDDGFLAAKAVYNRGGGLAPSIGHLPGVQLTAGSTTFSWCAAIRRITELGQGTTPGAQTQNMGYAMRAPQEVNITFDSNDARRAVRLGNTLYIAGGEILQYDGVQLVEVGFHVYPWFFDAVIGGGSLLPNGLYAYKSTLDYENAQGEIDRSTTATVANATMVGGPNGFIVETVSTPLTHKGAAPPVRIWRTAVNPSADAPFYLVTNLNPTLTSGANRYLPNAPTAIGFNPTVTDNDSDAVATVNEASPENGAELANLSPPAASIIAASVDRLFLGGVSGQPDTIWYSKQRDAGEVAAFNDELTVDLPPAGGAMTGIAFHPQTQTLIGFRRRAIYQLPGQGFDNTGEGSNYGPAIALSTDVGAVNPDAIAVAPFGVMFQTDKGWYKLDGGLNLSYIGDKVSAFDSDTVLAMRVVESRHQVRVVTNARVLVYDYLVGQWAEWTIATGVHTTSWNGSFVYLDSSSGPMIEATDYSSGVTYGMDVETAWIKPAGPQGRAVVRMLQAFGEYRSSHSLRIRVAIDYLQSGGVGGGAPVWIDDVIWPESPPVVGSVEQVRHGPSKKRCQSMKVRITAVAANATLPNPSPPTGEAVRLTGLALDAAIEGGLYSGLAPAQRD